MLMLEYPPVAWRRPDVDALEKLRALLAPGLDRAHGLILGAAADARAAVELRFGQISWQVIKRPAKWCRLVPTRTDRSRAMQDKQTYHAS
jgi:hypothetical protein